MKITILQNPTIFSHKSFFFKKYNWWNTRFFKRWIWLSKRNFTNNFYKITNFFTHIFYELYESVVWKSCMKNIVTTRKRPLSTNNRRASYYQRRVYNRCTRIITRVNIRSAYYSIHARIIAAHCYQYEFY